ncbi:MAG: ABC transporter substrate-binding protein [Clostridiales bacterium]|nr:ABC transporter substrate-binding protein [Clostridiales bacterium]
MKKIFAIAMALMLTLSCMPALAEDAVLELNFQRIGTNAAESAYWTWVVDEFNAANPGIKVVHNDAAIGPDMDTSLNTLYAAGDSPDIIGHGILSVAGRVEQGHYLPIDEYFANWEGKDNLMDSVLQNGVYKGKTYGIGYSTTPFVFAYRKDILEEAGLAVPTTWEELASTARALTKKNDNGEITFSGFCFPSAGGNLVELDVFVYGNGGKYMDENSNPIMTGDEKVEAIEYLKALLPDVNIAYSSGATNPFIKGQAAMTLINNVDLTSMMAAGSEYEGKVGIALPPNNGTEATFSGCNMLFMGRDCADKDAAWRFIEFVMTEESTLKRAEMCNIPVTLSSLSDEFVAMDPWNSVRIDCVEHGIGMPRAVWSPSFQTIRNELVQNVLFGDVDAETALKDAQEKLEFELDY